MAKRRHDVGAELPFVALMDTMTNVVGVLTIVLVMIGISLAKAVRKVLAEIPAATVEQVQAGQARLDQLVAARDANRKKLAAAKRDPLTDEKRNSGIIAELIRLELAVKDKDIRLYDFDSLRVEQAKREAELKAKRGEVDKLIAERDRLNALLDKTPVYKPPPDKVVRMPESRDIPEGSILYYAYVIGDQVHLVDPDSAKKVIMAEFERANRNWVREIIKVKNAKDRRVYDQTKVVEHFAQVKMDVRGQKITLPYNRPWTQLGFRIEINPKQGGVTIADPLPPNSEWHRMCNLVRSFPRGVLMFRVRPDSFATYLRAREVADACRVPCGWEIEGGTTYFEIIKDFEVNRLEQPPPPPPTKEPEGPPEPPPPKRRLD